MSNKLSCVVVDDEPLAIEVLESHIAQFEQLELVNSFQNPIKAFEFIKSHPVDLVFMDIQMPKLTGLDILRSLPQRPSVIITTAYRDYALEGFELEVADYLLKPISLDRFIRAISKVSLNSQNQPQPEQSETDALFLKVDKKMVKVRLGEILYIESQRDYLKVITGDQEIVTHMSISEAENVFPASDFVRVHRSFIVSKNQITSFSASEIDLGDFQVPIGRNYRSEVARTLNQMAGLN